MGKVKVTKDLENSTLIIEREFDAPKEKIWQFYANKELFEKWWGPEGWETTTTEFNFSVGGRVHYGMKCVDKNQGEWFGQESWGLFEILTIDEPNSLSVQDYFSNAEGSTDEKMPSQKLVVELVEKDGKTNIISRSIADKPESIEELIKLGMVEGFDSQLNKLEALLAE